MKKFYRHLDHTGDIGVLVDANSLEELFEKTSLALTDTLVNLSKVKAQVTQEWKIHAEDSDSLLVKHLEEILFRFDGSGMVYSTFHISFVGQTTLVCRVEGEKVDLGRHEFKTELKAVTYHRLSIEKKNDCWRAQVIFDV